MTVNMIWIVVDSADADFDRSRHGSELEFSKVVVGCGRDATMHGEMMGVGDFKDEHLHAKAQTHSRRLSL